MGCFGYICKGCGTSIRGNCWTGGEKCVLIHVRHGEEVGRVEGHYDEYGRVIEQKELSEEEKFRGDNEGINGHSEICDSEFSKPDSYDKVLELRTINDGTIDETDYSSEYRKKRYGSPYIMNFDQYVNHLCLKEQYNGSLSIMNNPEQSYLFEFLPTKEKKEIEGIEYPEKGDVVENEESAQRIKCMIKWDILKDTLRYLDTELSKKFKAFPEVKLEKYSGIVAWHSACYHKATEEQKTDLTPSKSDPNQSWGKVRKKYS